MNQINLESVKKVHFIGIGGIGLSAVARMFILEGKQVIGSDKRRSRVTDQLEKMGAQIHIGEHSAEFLSSDTDLVVYSVAVQHTNPEREEVKRRSLPTLSYPEVLGYISREYKTIAVSGTHGKTTTTAMVGKILKGAGLDPKIIVGSLLVEEGNNYVHGRGEYFVVEADEYRRAFLNLSPFVLIIINLEADHLDYYKDLVDIQNAFGELAEKIPEKGCLICDTTNLALAPIIKRAKAKIVNYREYFDDGLKLQIPGEHYLMDAAAAAAAAASLGISRDIIQKALESYSGTWRRFEYKGKTKDGALVYDDYAHHPTEIKATLKAAKEHFRNKRLTVLFQPHQYGRTKALFDDFAHAFGDADSVYLLPIEQIREEKDPAVSSEKLVKAMQKIHLSTQVVGSYDAATELLKENLEKDDVLFTMGATDVYKVGERLLELE